MKSDKKVLRFPVLPGVMFLQLIMTQVVTFLLSFLFPDMESFPQTHSGTFVVILGISFSIGVFSVGWLALNKHWLNLRPKYLARMIGTLLGAYFPLIIALLIYRSLEPGNPFFFVSILASILGFYVPGFFDKK